MFGLGPFEMAVIAIVAVILFGGNLPEVARKLGQSYGELKRSMNDMQQQFRAAENEVRTTVSETTSYVDEEEEDFAAPAAPKFKPPA